MPKQKKITKRLKAVNLAKPYIKAGFNQSKLARKRGVNRATICEQVHRKPTIDSLQEYLNSPVLKRRLVAVAKDGLSAKLPNKKRTKDHDVRHKFWRDLGAALGVLKVSDGQKVQVFVGADFENWVGGIEKNKKRSDVRPD